MSLRLDLSDPDTHSVLVLNVAQDIVVDKLNYTFELGEMVQPEINLYTAMITDLHDTVGVLNQKVDEFEKCSRAMLVRIEELTKRVSALEG